MYIYSLECYISYGDESVFSVQNSTSNPKLSTKVKLDYENTTQYSVVVVAQDLANECHKGRALVQINVVFFGLDIYVHLLSIVVLCYANIIQTT